MRVSCSIVCAVAALALAGCAQNAPQEPGATQPSSLWQFYQDELVDAKYVDLTHTITPYIPVWRGFNAPKFGPAVSRETGEPYTLEEHGFVASDYHLTTDQLGTQLDPPAHWSEDYAAIDELPPTYAVRPLVVISIEDQVAEDFGYSLTVDDIHEWEARNGRIPEGSVVMVRSGWSRTWPDPALAQLEHFPGVSLPALKFLHEQRHILFHGHEPLDTDDTVDFAGEAWLLHNGYAQAEGVAHLDQVPETGCLINMGFPKFKGGVGGYARYIAICPSDWKYGVSVTEAPGAPMPKMDKPLRMGPDGVRVRE